MAEPKQRYKHKHKLMVIGLQDNYDPQKQRSLSPIGTTRRQSIELHSFSRSDKSPLDDNQSDTNLSSETPGSDSSSRQKSAQFSLGSRSDDDVSDVEVADHRTSQTSKSRTSDRSRSTGSSKGSISVHSSAKEPRISKSRGHSRESTLLDFGPLSDFTDDDLDLGRLSRRPGDADSSEMGTDDTELEYFCVDHMQLCTARCIENQHVDCENIVPASEWAEKQKLDKDKKLIESILQKYDTFAGIMITEREDFRKQLESQKEEATDDFLDLMEDVITHILHLQKKFTTRFGNLHDEKMKAISEQIKRCKMIQRETSSLTSELAVLEPGTPEYQEMKEKVILKGPVYEEILRRDFQASTRIGYEFESDPKALAIMSDVRNLGDIVLHPKPAKLPGFMSISKETDYSRRGVTDIKKHEAKHSADQNPCCFSACTFISNGRIVLADWNNQCLKVFNKSCVLVQRLPLSHNPWDVKVSGPDKLVVTVPSERSILTVDCQKELEVISEFQTEVECYGIAVIDGKFAVTCDPWSKTPSVQIYSSDGKLLSFFQKNTDDQLLFRYPQHITTDHEQTIMYVSDTRLNQVIALTPDGDVFFRYCHEKLDSPTGITTDSQGHIYVCGKDSSNIHQISKEGVFIKILLRAGDELTSPQGVCFEPNGDRIAVTDLGSPGNDEFMTAVLT